MPSYLLLIFNLILLAASWVMLIYAYPRLPSLIPLWLNFSGSPFLYSKSLLIFLYPLGETIFNLLFIKLAKLARLRIRWPQPKKAVKGLPATSDGSRARLRQEFALLALIFFNLIFIHVERSLILVAHQVEKGVNSFYFLMLFLILIMLIPYYRIRELMEKKQSQRRPHVSPKNQKGKKLGKKNQKSS